MDNIIKDLNLQLKVYNDGKAQNKLITSLNNLLENIKTLEKKKLNEFQPFVEEILYNLVINNKGNNDLCNRYIFLTYKYIFEHGIGSKLSDFLVKYVILLQNSKLSNNIKGLVLWLIGKVCSKVQGKTCQFGELLHVVIKLIKNNNEGLIRMESFRLLYRILRLKHPSLHNSTNEIFKLIIKQEKNTESRKCVLKALDACLFFFNSINFQQQYESIIGFLFKIFEDEDFKIRQISIDIYINCHLEKVFDQQINTAKILKRKILEPSKNFLEIILCFGNYLNTSKNDISNNLRNCLFKIIQIFVEKNVEFLNSQEKLNISILDILISYFPIQFTSIPTNFLNYRFNLLNLNKDQSKISVSIPQTHHEIEDLYRRYIRQILTTGFRKILLKYIFKKLNESQNDLDNIENFVSNIKKGIVKSNSSKNSKGDKNSFEKFTEFQINALLICLLELSENNSDLLELTFGNFQDLSQILEVYLISSVKSFRMIMSRVLINFAYFIPSWRTHILTLILNLSSVAHAEVAALKNTFMYFVDENQPEYKYSLILRNNLDLLNDISNCLASILTVYSHKNYGIPVDLSNAALSIAKNMISGKFADEENPKAQSIKEKSKNYNTNCDVDAHKEAGWMIIQGLVSMDYTWLTNNFKTLFQLWKYVFAENSCFIEESELQKAEYREALLSEFFIKKSALAALRKFILSSFDFTNAQSFQILIPKFLSNALNFFMPNDQKKTLYFFRQILKEKYKQAKIIFFDCYLSIPIHLYTNKFVPILHAVCDDVVADYPEYTNEIILSNLNWYDNFLCEKNFIFGNNFHDKQKNYELNNYLIDNFGIEKFNITFTNQIAFDINAKIVDSSVNLLVEILLDSNLNIKNRQQILKHFLSHLSTLNSKTKEICKINKALNIVYALYILFKKSFRRNTYVVNDEHIFTNSKMIFDLGMSIDSNLIRRISSEGHGLLISVSSNPTQNLDFYIKEFDCKMVNSQLIDPNHTNNILFLIANIFRYNDFNQISRFLDNFFKIIHFFFSKSDDFCNQWFSQSILIICQVLLKSNLIFITDNQIERCRKLIDIYKFNFFFINKDNNIYFKELLERNSLAELKLLIIYSSLKEINQNEIDMVIIIMNKYFMDEKYRSPGITRIFLYFVKNCIMNQKLKDHINKTKLLEILLSILSRNHNRQAQINYLNDLETKIILEIIIYLILNIDKNIDSMKDIAEYMVLRINYYFNDNKYFYFNNIIFNQVYNSISTKDIIYEKNNEDILIKISNLINLEGKSDEQQKNIIFDLIYSRTLLIKLSKIILKLYFEKKFNNYLSIINFMKDIIHNQSSFYVSSKSAIKLPVNSNSESLKSDEANETSVGQKSILIIKNLNIVLHFQVKKFLLKSLKTTLNLTLILNNDLKGDNQTNQNTLIEFLNSFMNLSLLLISCDESWEIKIVGVKLLIATIKKFSHIKDPRMEDNSLLLQQYEAQINSCIKKLFNYSHSIKSVFYSIKIYYYFLSIPITNDPTYIKKTINLIDINIKQNITQTAFSEKFDHLLICKKYNFFCDLYLSFIKYNKIISISVINSCINTINIYYENLNKSLIENFGEFFKSTYEIFFYNIYLMLIDCHVVLSQDKKTAKNYKNYNFISSGNRISYSYNKLMKYSQTYLKVFGFLANDVYFLSIFRENPEFNKKISSIDISPIFYLIFYFLNHFSIKKLQPVNSENESKISEYIIYSENDITDELREKIILNSLMISEIIDNMVCYLSSEIFYFSNKLFFEIFKICINLFTLSIDEIDCKLFNILELLILKLENNDKTNLDISEKNQFFISLGKFCLFYFNNKLFSNPEIETLIYSKMIDLSNLNIINFMKIKESFEQDNLNEYILGIMKIIFSVFKDSINPGLFKLSASKLFNSILIVKDFDLLKNLLSQINELLNFFLLNNNFEKFFTLYFTLLQFSSKKILEIKSFSEVEEEEISSENKRLMENVDLMMKFIIFLSTEILDKNNNIPFLTKAMLLAFSTNNDQIFKKYFEHILYYILNKETIKLVITDIDFQKLVLSYIFTLEDQESVKMLSNILILKLNANFECFEMNNSNLEKVCMIVYQLMNKDKDFYQNISRHLKKSLIEKIEILIKAHESIKQNQVNNQYFQSNLLEFSEKKKEIKEDKISIQNTTSTKVSNQTSTTSKLKALKFSNK